MVGHLRWVEVTPVHESDFALPDARLQVIFLDNVRELVQLLFNRSKEIEVKT